jgi:hypothetical protein
LTFVLNDRARKTAAGLSMDIGGAGFLLTINWRIYHSECLDRRQQRVFVEQRL